MVVLVKPFFFFNFECFLRIKERMLYKAYDIVCSGGLTGRNVKYIHCCLEYDADYANDYLRTKHDCFQMDTCAHVLRSPQMLHSYLEAYYKHLKMK